jgi:hypothetical protein
MIQHPAPFATALRTLLRTPAASTPAASTPAHALAGR